MVIQTGLSNLNAAHALGIRAIQGCKVKSNLPSLTDTFR
jgi:hypothetical protein